MGKEIWGMGTHAKTFVIIIEEIKIPKIILPKGYIIRKSTGSKIDVEKWCKVRYRSAPHPTYKNDAVILVEFNDEPVGGTMITESPKNSNIYSQNHTQILPKHRRKGLYRALMIYCLQYCKDIKARGFKSRVSGWVRQFWVKRFCRLFFQNHYEE